MERKHKKCLLPVSATPTGSAAKGFTLVEAVIIAAVLAVAAVVLGGVMAGAVRGQRAAGDSFRAVCLAQEKVEQLKPVPFDQISSEPEADVPGYPGFKRSVTVEQVDAYTKRVTVRVTCPAPGAAAQVLVFERTADL
ncbi:hypothetical protein E308F_16700 [Moorella sp. E308F]|uniref:hypothetical protein n=1 Tax=unclassified Neomoorella TaxID=2676739 RepID=UPI0010FFBB87|nr:MULTISPECIES: hypothetical protein [unclassified Moorella (in: firmicutes)]GEA15426.1 hypothetical protein E308F_16700 [Moorella sp. E308F]GEA19714.1 hypothetical protein E306M_28530 [Moorella sp. E306M]